MKNQNTAELQKQAQEVTKPSSPHLLYFCIRRTNSSSSATSGSREGGTQHTRGWAVPCAAPCLHGEAAPCCTALPYWPRGTGLFPQGCPVSVTLSIPVQTHTSPAPCGLCPCPMARQGRMWPCASLLRAAAPTVLELPWLSLSKRNFRFDLGEFLFFISAGGWGKAKILLIHEQAHLLKL